MTGLIGKKRGMTSFFDEDGNDVPCTVIEVRPNVVAQVKTEDGKDGYDAVQLGAGEKNKWRATSAHRGQFESVGANVKDTLSEFRDYGEDVEAGDTLYVEDVFEAGQTVDVAGVTKGKGFQGVVKRHGFSGVGMQTHGQSDQERHPGSIGGASDPARVFPGMEMGGRTGGELATMKNLRVMKVIPDNHALLVSGSVPGPKDGYVEVYRHDN